MTTSRCNTGFPAIDRMLAGGIPAGQLCCFVAHRPPFDEGPKSSIMLHTIHQAVIQGVPVLYTNVESAIDEAHFQQLGLDNK